jgi:hypothetical protein
MKRQVSLAKHRIWEVNARKHAHVPTVLAVQHTSNRVSLLPCRNASKPCRGS